MTNKNTPQINWDEQPSKDAVWIVDSQPVCEINFDGWYEYYHEKGCFRRVSDDLMLDPYYLTSGGLSICRREDCVIDSADEGGEWIPKAGKRCVHIYGGGVATHEEEEEVLIIGIDKLGNYVFQNDKSTCYYSDPAVWFIPLKTQQKKEREAFIDSVYNQYMDLDIVISDSDLHKLALRMFERGFTAPKGEGDE